MDSYKVLLSGGVGEIVEKKSRFIATVRKCGTEAEAAAFIDEMKKKYWDASHNCSAFVIGGEGGFTRCSDDGEPAGTAGRPMLEVLLGEGIRDAAVVVTRYFGGTLLGTGGLVRAYGQAVKAGLAACTTGTMRRGWELVITTDYNNIGRVLYTLSRENIAPIESNYAESVTLRAVIPCENSETLIDGLVGAARGRIKIEKIKDLYYVQNN
ncbi:MAG: YigZ family protein [Lachnospiraceae bacterium]|nr:YigZ family protein [Lachnospiraceae bacterium]